MFASDLGWKPGQWPHEFEHEGQIWRRGDVFRAHGEFQGYQYSSADASMTVFND